MVELRYRCKYTHMPSYIKERFDFNFFQTEWYLCLLIWDNGNEWERERETAATVPAAWNQDKDSRRKFFFFIYFFFSSGYPATTFLSDTWLKGHACVCVCFCVYRDTFMCMYMRRSRFLVGRHAWGVHLPRLSLRFCSLVDDDDYY